MAHLFEDGLIIDGRVSSMRHSIIGVGRLGSALAALLESRGDEVVCTLRNEAQAEELRRRGRKVLMWDEPLPQADMYWLALPDASLGSIAAELAGRAEALPAALALHCSGALPAKVLAPFASLGWSVAAMHPYQTLIEGSRNLVFEGVLWAIETQEQAMQEQLADFVKSIGGVPFIIGNNERQRALYHASAVIASNMLVGLFSVAVEVAKKANLNPKEAIPAIMRRTVENCIAHIEQEEIPLTGPLIRGDIETIERHLKALDGYSHLEKAYTAFSEGLLAMIEKAGTLPQSTIDDVQKLLHNTK